MRLRLSPLLLAGVLLAGPPLSADEFSGSDRSMQAPGEATHDDSLSDESLSSDELNTEADQAAGTADDASVTTAESADVTRGVFDSPLRLSPRVGAIGFQDSRGEYTSRGAAGVTLDLSLADLIGDMGGVEFGFETGLLYSHIGSVGGDFWGFEEGPLAGSNSGLVPLHLTAGYGVSDGLLATIGVGSTMLYRSIPQSMLIGRSDFDADDRIDFLPSVGLNIGYGLGPVALSLRGDYIPAPADDLFTATLGAMIPLA
jgi:hypothetical protein